MDIFLSVIIPIYKVELYLRECVESILAESLQDMEVILVNDGSPDHCPEICDYFAKRDARIRVIHQENRGLVNARKSGCRVARGKYITFIDGDDWITPGMFSSIKKDIMKKNIDIYITDFIYDIDGKKNYRKNKIEAGFYQGEELKKLQEKMIYFGKFFCPGIFPALWNKWYRREILLSNIFLVDEKITWGEDMACTYPCLLDVNTVKIDNGKTYYHYRYRSESMTKAFDPKYFQRFNYLYEYLENCFERKGRKDLFTQLYYHKVFTTVVGIELEIGSIKDIIMRKSRNNIKKSWDNIYVTKNVMDVNIKQLIIPYPYRAVYNTYFNKKIDTLLLKIIFLKIYKKIIKYLNN